MKKRVFLLVSGLLSLVAIFISSYALKRLINTEKSIAKRYENLTRMNLKFAEKLSSINLDLLNKFYIFLLTRHTMYVIILMKIYFVCPHCVQALLF